MRHSHERQGNARRRVRWSWMGAVARIRTGLVLCHLSHDGGPAKSAPKIIDAVRGGRATVESIRKQFVEEGMEETLQPKASTRVHERRLDGKAEEHLMAIACGAPPADRSRWPLRLLGNRLIALGLVESIVHLTV